MFASLDRKYCFASSLSLTRVGVYVGVCVYVRKHCGTHTQTLGRPEECKWTKSRHTCTRVCVQRTHVYIYARRRDKIWTNCSFSLTYCFPRKRKAKDVIVRPRTRIDIESELHRPQSEDIQLLIVIKANIIIVPRCG